MTIAILLEDNNVPNLHIMQNKNIDIGFRIKTPVSSAFHLLSCIITVLKQSSHFITLCPKSASQLLLSLVEVFLYQPSLVSNHMSLGPGSVFRFCSLLYVLRICLNVYLIGIKTFLIVLLHC